MNLAFIILIAASQSNGDVRVARRQLVYEECTVTICAHGDNYMDLDVSTDDGANWNNLASENSWSTAMSLSYSGTLNANTQFRFTIEDVGYVTQYPLHSVKYIFVSVYDLL